MRGIIIYGIIGFLFCFFQITGHDLAGQGNIVWTFGYVLRTTLFSLTGGACFGGFCHGLPEICKVITGRFTIGKNTIGRQKKGFTESVTDEKTHSEVDLQTGRGLRIWLTSFLLLFFCWLPCYLAYYPGICAYDVTIQTGQIVDGIYNDHHPIAHTLLIEGSMKLGAVLFGDANMGIGLMVFGQMLALAAVFAWGVSLLWRRKVRRRWCVCLQLFGMLYPFHMYMSVSLIKDIFFTVFFLMQMLALCEMISRRDFRINRYDIVFLVSAVGMQLFRNNGGYAMLVLLVMLILTVIFSRTDKRFWAKLMGNCVVALVLGSLCLSGLFALTQAQQGDRREMLSMPIQQLARCMLYHGGIGELAEDDGTMDAQSRALIDDFLLDESYRLYRPEISDPVKSHTNTYVVRYRAGDFIRTYLHLLGTYPGDFINAALAVNAGYLYVEDESHAFVNQNGTDKGLGYIQTRWVESELNPRGIYKASKWEWLHEKLEKWADENSYLRLPVLKYLFVPGTFLWLYLLLAGALILRRKYAGCMPLVLVLGYYVTLFLGPVVQLRYLYPLMLALPFLAVFLLQEDFTAVRG